MQTSNPIVLKIATLVSAVGHPLLILAVFTLFITFRTYNLKTASLISFVTIGAVIVPITIRNYLKYKRKEYTNFDVSDRLQRKSFYRFGIALLLGVTILLYFIQGAESFFTGSLVALLMIVVSAGINTRLKTSLHTSTAMFLSVVLFDINESLAIVLFVFSFFVAWSRLVLKRHTIEEVISGAIIGMTFGMVNHYAQNV